MSLYAPQLSPTPEVAFGFSDQIAVQESRDVIYSVERRDKMRMTMLAPNISLNNIELSDEERVIASAHVVDLFSNTTWESQCYAHLTCLGFGGGYGPLNHYISVANVWRTGSDKLLVAFRRIFSPAPELDAQVPPLQYLPTATFAKCVQDLHSGLNTDGGAVQFILGTAGMYAIASWILALTFAENEGTVPLWPVMVMMRNQILHTEELYAARLVVGNTVEPRTMLHRLAAGRILGRIEQHALDQQYGIKVMKRIGAGGVGELYLASRATGESIAIKVLSPDWRFNADDRMEMRFREEYDILVDLSRLGITPMAYESGTFIGRSFFAEEFLPWPSLRDWASARDRSLDERVEVVRRLIDVVAAMHRAGIVHRDLSPKNILVSEDGSAVKLIDFGVAIRSDRVGDSDFADVDIAGSLKYVAPETRDSPRLASRYSDSFSLAIIIYELILEQQIAGVLPPLSAVMSDFPEDISSYAFSAAQFDRGRRALPEEFISAQ
jgi:tRNA A-37 threonylcarbamoyl transferase component Bud32